MSDDSDSVTPRRRASDRAPGVARALAWGERDSDMLLLPHSPLALADVLAHPHGHFDLLACASPELVSRSSTQDEPPPASPARSQARVQSITAAQPRRRGPRTSGNLLTRHSASTLRERLRAAVVEAALVRQRDERRLYLVAGFLRADGLDAPVLMYPSLLITEQDGKGPRLRIEDTVPDQNRQAIAHCRTTFDVQLPALERDELLADYFARLAAAIAPIAGLDLAFEIAIGNADASFLHDPSDGPTLPALPERFDAPLAMALAGELSLEQLQGVRQLVPPRSAHPMTAAGGTSNGTDSTARLRSCSAKLASRGLDHIAFGQMGELPERIDRWRLVIAQAQRCTTVSRLFAGHVFTVTQLARLGGIIELIDKAPTAIEAARHADLAYESTTHLLRRARHQAQLLEDEFAALQAVFVLDKVPGKSELLQLMDDLGGVHGDLAVIDQDYFHARRQFMEFSVEKPAQLDEQHRRHLSQLVKVLRFRELFVNNTEYRRALGTGYRGLRTDWNALNTIVGYARELASVLGSETLAATAMRDFTAFRTALIDDLDTLRTGADALSEAVATIGPSWRGQSVSALLVHLEETAERLRIWQDRFADLSWQESLTPADVLSRTGDTVRSDAASEHRLRIARERVAQSLQGGGDQADTVLQTLDWLQLAGQRAAERRLDVDAILDYLQLV